MKGVFITGVAGFIGFHLAGRLLEQGRCVVGMDQLNDYYDPMLKKHRLAHLAKHTNFRFKQTDLADTRTIEALMKEHDIALVVHLAAQPGVRYSLENPLAYIDSNVTGFTHLLEACRKQGIRHLLYASSSSVYGSNVKVPYASDDPVDHPVSFYAATKRAGELIAHSYSHNFGLPTTGLRFFTVYGPWGRPDMAYFSFTKRILAGQPIQVYNHGDMKRDFTYIDDVIRAMELLLDQPPFPDSVGDSACPRTDRSSAPYRLYNIGNHSPVSLLEMIGTLERLLDRKANLEFLPMQPGEARETFADIEPLRKAIGFRPTTVLETGLRHFVNWYRDYYGS